MPLGMAVPTPIPMRTGVAVAVARASALAMVVTGASVVMASTVLAVAAFPLAVAVSLTPGVVVVSLTPGVVVSLTLGMVVIGVPSPAVVAMVRLVAFVAMFAFRTAPFAAVTAIEGHLRGFPALSPFALLRPLAPTFVEPSLLDASTFLFMGTRARARAVGSAFPPSTFMGDGTRVTGPAFPPSASVDVALLALSRGRGPLAVRRAAFMLRFAPLRVLLAALATGRAAFVLLFAPLRVFLAAFAAGRATVLSFVPLRVLLASLATPRAATPVSLFLRLRLFRGLGLLFLLLLGGLLARTLVLRLLVVEEGQGVLHRRVASHGERDRRLRRLSRLLAVDARFRTEHRSAEEAEYRHHESHLGHRVLSLVYRGPNVPRAL